MFTNPPPISSFQQRLPNPYRPEASVVASLLTPLQAALDWAAAAQIAQPWVQAVRKNPPPFWAMESLLIAPALRSLKPHIEHGDPESSS